MLFCGKWIFIRHNNHRLSAFSGCQNNDVNIEIFVQFIIVQTVSIILRVATLYQEQLSNIIESSVCANLQTTTIQRNCILLFVNIVKTLHLKVLHLLSIFHFFIISKSFSFLKFVKILHYQHDLFQPKF